MKAFVNAGATVHGCYFHLCQAVWLHVCNSGMKTQYNTDKAFRSAVRALMALVCVKKNDVPRFFDTPKQKVADDASLCVVYDSFKSTWIDGFGADLMPGREDLRNKQQRRSVPQRAASCVAPTPPL